ncbi:MAG: cyclic nucleotide-binding domain-containing protein [Betaproteobacteria bacterium]
MHLAAECTLARIALDPQLAKLLAVAREVSFMRGADLVRQGEASRGAFIIRSGEAEARVALPGGGAYPVARFGEGDLFGEMALVDRGVCSATVVAHSNVDAWFVSRDELRGLVAGRDAAGFEALRAVTRVLSAKLSALNARVRAYPAAEDRPLREAPPAGDPLDGVPRSHRASFEWRRFLRVLAFFEGFDEGDRDELASYGKALELKRGAWVFVAGRPAAACYLVVRGALELFASGRERERRVAIAGPGELVGFMAVVNDAPRANDARVREDCCLLEIPRAAFMATYRGNSSLTVSLQRAIHRSLLVSIARTNTQLTRLITHARLREAEDEARVLEGLLGSQVVTPKMGSEQFTENN